MAFLNPILVITRPASSAARVLNELRAACPRPFRPILSPVFDYAPVAAPSPEPFFGAIFSSFRAVEAAPAGAGRPAWCVGGRTASVAQRAGYEVRDADGTAEDVLDLILSERPEGRLVHFRGEVSRGRIAERLNAAGLTCVDRVVYRKAPLELSSETRSAFAGTEPVIVPLFSPETVSILAKHGPITAPLICACISEPTAQEATQMNPQRIVISDRPTQSALVACVAELIA